MFQSKARGGLQKSRTISCIASHDGTPSMHSWSTRTCAHAIPKEEVVLYMGACISQSSVVNCKPRQYYDIASRSHHSCRRGDGGMVGALLLPRRAECVPHAHHQYSQ